MSHTLHAFTTLQCIFWRSLDKRGTLVFDTWNVILLELDWIDLAKTAERSSQPG